MPLYKILSKDKYNNLQRLRKIRDNGSRIQVWNWATKKYLKEKIIDVWEIGETQ